MNVGVISFPGSNCDRDCHFVCNDILKQSSRLIWHQETSLKNIDLVILPGGFSYGDYLRTGAIARFSPIMDSIIEFASHGGLVLGICNGFQILLEVGLLPGAMLRNTHLSFICENVSIKVENADTPFTNQFSVDQILNIPIAHAEGNYYADSTTLSTLHEHGQIVFRYCSGNGTLTNESNPNGSLDHIAGICNQTRNVLGMMPHPERSAEAVLGSTDGILLFNSVLNTFEKSES